MRSSDSFQKPWSHWVERDDRSWLKALSDRKWSTEECHKSLGTMLESIVTSLHYSSHSRWGVQPSQDRLRKISQEFLDWMHESKEWTHLESSWKSCDGPWSLPLALSRSYVRYRQEKGHTKERDHSHSAAHSLKEVSSSAQSAGVVSDAILDAFTSMSHQLPNSHRLIYQLHLEGLLNDEIASLLRLETNEVDARVNESKRLLSEDIFRKSGSS